MKKIFTGILFFIVALVAMAEQRTEAECMQIAIRHFNQQTRISQNQATNSPIELVSTASQALGRASRNTGGEAFYIYGQGENAFVIVSGDDTMKPVLGYSDESKFSTENMPSNLRGLLSLYVEQAEQAAQGQTAPKAIASMGGIKKALESEPKPSVSPLLGNIAYNQDAPYNTLCPEKSMTGCVATAMAMIMKHHEYPRIGRGRHSYVTSMHGYSVSHDFEEKRIDWNSILDTYTEGQYTEAEATAIAELMKACGVSVDMNYDIYSSAASALKVANGLTTYFRYNENLQFRIRDVYTSDEWMGMIKNELSNNRPVLYNGSSKEVGHEFVLDGYDEENMIHINWGWGGMANGYFELATLDPLNPGIGGGTSAGGGYTYSQGMITGIKPETVASEMSHSWYMTALYMLSSPDENGQLPITEQVSLGAVTLANYGATYNGEMGIALATELDSEDAQILGKKTIASIPPGTGGNLQFDFTIPSDTPDGYYYIYLSAKAFKAQKWERVRTTVGYLPYIVVKVENDMVTYYDPRQAPKLTGSYEVKGDLVINKYGDFEVTVKNAGTEYYYGNVGVLITPSQQSDKAAIYLDEVYLAPGEERTVTFTKALVNTETAYLEEGTAQICGAYSYGEALFPLTQFSTIDIGYAKLPKLTLNGKLETQKESFAADEEFVLPVSITCEGDYDQYLVAAIFPYGAQQTNVQVHEKVEMTDGNTYELELRGLLQPQPKVGKYLVALYYFDISTGAYTGELGYTTFDITEATGIEDVKNSTEGVKISAQGDVLTIQAPFAILNVDVYNTAGCKMLTQAANGSEMRGISTAGLAPGAYLLRIQTENGVVTKKFIKK